MMGNFQAVILHICFVNLQKKIANLIDFLRVMGDESAHFDRIFPLTVQNFILGNNFQEIETAMKIYNSYCC